MQKIAVVLAPMACLSLTVASAQDTDKPVGIDALCGEKALAFTTLQAPPEDDQTRALDAVLRSFVTVPTESSPALSALGPKPPAPGAVVFVDSPAGRYFRAIGVADVATCAPLDPAMPFAIGSNTKMMTAAIIFQLQEDGLLSVDDLVSKYLPEEIKLFEGAETITINMLLRHTSGLPDYLNSKNPTSIGVLDADPQSGELETGFTPQELIANAAENAPLLFAPDAAQKWAYSNTGYIMLGLIIEEVAGQPYNEALTKRIIEPLQLKNTLPIAEFTQASLGLPSSYLQSPFTYVTSGWNYRQAWSAGNVVSTAEDMAVFLRALYSGKLFQQAATLKAMLTPAAPGAPDFSDNFYYFHGGFYKHGFLGHGGQTLGFMSDVGYLPQQDVVIVTWTNSAESFTGQGVYHVGKAFGLTPTFDEMIFELQFGTRPKATVPPVEVVSIADVSGLTFRLDSLYSAKDQKIGYPDPSATYTIQFKADGTLAIVADCNMVQATYTVGAENAVTITLGASTLVACAKESLADTYLAILADTDSVIITKSEGVLTLIIGTTEGSSLALKAVP